MRRIKVPSGTVHGPVTVEHGTGSEAISLEQGGVRNRGSDVIMVRAEHAPALINAIANASPASPVQETPKPETVPPLDFYYAVPTGTDSGAIELGAHTHGGRIVALLRQADGADEDGEITFSTLALNAHRIDGLIESLQSLKRLVL